jgi:polysaccharide pyruvyl transferase WcaK-like protein
VSTKEIVYTERCRFMRILVEPSGYSSPLLNVGDIAMQQVILTRLAQTWPEAEIEVLTLSPDAFPYYAPNVRPLSTFGRQLWLSGMLRNRRIPKRLQLLMTSLLQTHPGIQQFLSNLWLKMLPSRWAREVDRFLQSARSADILVICGMGGVTDSFDLFALNLLDTVKLVKQNGKSLVLMFGQGFGPVAEKSVLFNAAREIMPMVDFIGLRESRASVPLLRRFGVDPGRVFVTGDDALELAVQHRSRELGTGIGVNVRVALYSEVTDAHVQQLGVSLRRFASPRSIPFIPLPCSAHPEEPDDEFIRLVLGGTTLTERSDRVTPEEMIAGLHKCRITVVGSYHAAIFALAQGVPVIGIYRSAYYRDKFLGLAHMFGPAVMPLDLADQDWSTCIGSRMADAWEMAPTIRLQLQSTTEKFLRDGRTAFEQARELVDTHLHEMKNSLL